MKSRVARIARYAAYPAVYLFCLGFFGYLTFPYDRLKDRLVAEFTAAQLAKQPSKPPRRLEIDKVSSYWFSGLEMEGVRLILPPDPVEALAKGDDKAPPKDTIVVVDEAHVRVRMLPLLLGRVKIDFWASAFGGEVSGVVPVGGASGAVEVALEEVDLSKVEALTTLLGIPLMGVASGRLELAAAEGKFNKANGSLELTIKDAAVGDGVTKIKGMLALPTAKLGEVTISADAKDGVLKVTKFAAPGPDVEVVGDGKIAVREPWNDSSADLYVRFKFSDAYRGKNDLTKSLLGAPGSAVPAVFELDPKVKRAKRADGFYGWHAHGPLKRLRFDPSSTDAPGGSGGSTTSPRPPRGKPGDSPFGGGIRKAAPPPPPREVDDEPSPPPHSPPPPPEPVREEPAQPVAPAPESEGAEREEADE